MLDGYSKTKKSAIKTFKKICASGYSCAVW